MDICLHELRIRNAAPADCRRLADWWNDGAVMAHAGFPNGLGTTPEEVGAQLAAESDDRGRTLILERGGRAVGEMNYRLLGGGTAEIGIKICEAEHREKGLGKLALSMLIRELFSLGCTKIVLDTNLKNLRAQHVYERLGFERKRINLDAWTDQLGRPQSSVDYELSPERFRDYSTNAGGTT